MSDDRSSIVSAGAFPNDEPTSADNLDRGRYARAFARLALTCQTPMVVGLYGTWGIGKTSLMLQIQEKLKADGTPTVWFDPWRHQFDEDPIIALLQTMVVQLGKETVETVREALTSVALALSSPVLKASVGLSFEDYRKIYNFVAEHRFRVRTHQIRLQKEIKDLIERTRKKNKRVVFFIDDLDRCVPDNVLRMLEALKLYLNVENCVYFLGLDHTTIRKAIEEKYKQLAVSDQNYLDKIIQIPFLIPRIHAERAKPFIESLLPEEAKDCAQDLVEFLGDNPRQVKRFANVLSLNLLLASEIFSGPDQCNVRLIVALLLIQLKNEALFRQISANSRLYFELTATGEEAAKLTQDYFSGDTQLQRMVQRVGCPENTPIERYVHLADVAGASVREDKDTRNRAGAGGAAGGGVLDGLAGHG